MSGIALAQTKGMIRISFREFLRHLALPCLLYVVLFFGGSEIIEHVYLNKLPDSIIHWLHFVRGVLSVFFVAALVMFLLSRIQQDFTHQMESVCTLLNVANDGLIAFDSYGQMLSANARALELLGCAESGNFRKWKKEICARIKDRGELQCFNPAGTIRLRVLALQTHESGTLLLLQDITDEKRMEEQWLIAEKMASIGRMAAGLAHEIGTPLNVISGRAELIQAMHPTSDSVQKHTRVILEQTERIAGIIQQLLTQARQRNLNRENFSLNEIVLKVGEMLQLEMDKKNITLDLELEADLPLFFGFEDQFHQVLINLLTNAMDAMEGKAGSIHVVTKRHNECVELRVSDSGCGIPEENLNKVFDPFFTTKEFGKGTGLGLTVTSNIIQSHGGTIQVESDKEYGTRFVIHLPRVSAEIGRKSERTDVRQHEAFSQLHLVGHP